MHITGTILYKSFVRTFYKQHAGLFAFLVFIMIASVGRANEVGLLEYHFTLIRAMLTDMKFLAFVLTAWLFYGLKCEQFITDTLQRKNYVFIFALNSKPSSFVFMRMLQVQLMLFLPVILYAGICMTVGIVHQWYANTFTIFIFIVLACVIGAWRYNLLIRKNGMIRPASFVKPGLSLPVGHYVRFIIQYISHRRKMLFLGIKIFSCLMIFGMLLYRTKDESDLSMFLLFYSFGLLGHGILIYKIRQIEEVNLGFYRGLPVSLSSRLIQYAVLYLIILIPEIIIFVQMSRVHLNYSDALRMIFFGWGILLMLHSLLFIRLFQPLAYLKIISGIYFLIFIAILAGFIVPFTICLFLVSAYLFFQHYYQFETAEGDLQ